MCESPQDRELRERLEGMLHEFSQHRESNIPAIETSEREKALSSKQRYHDIKNAICMEIQMQKRLEALECVMEAYPINYTLKDVKEQLECSMQKNDKEIRKLMNV